MKKLFTFLALVLGLVSCQTEPEGFDVNVGGEQDVNITVSLPEGTRSNSALGAFDNVDLSGDATIRYILKIYQKVGDEYKASTNRQVEYSDGKSVVFPVRLVPNRHYRFVVWADYVKGEADVDNHYNTTDLANITLNDTWVAMDETRDAFTGYFDTEAAGEKYTSASSINIKLTRPFAKLRVITTDMKELGYLSIEPHNAVVTYTTQFHESFNAFNGQYGAETVSKTHISFDIKDYDDNVAEKSKVLFTDYFFADDSDVVKFVMNVNEANGALIKSNTFNTDIPVKRNYVTTIQGNILTDGNNVKVDVDKAFENADNLEDKPYYNEIVEVGNAIDLQEAIDNSTEETTIVLGGNINLGDLLSAGILSTRAAAALPIVIPEGKVVALDLNGFNLTTPFVEGSTTNHTYAFENHGSLTIQDSKGNGQIIARGIFNYGTMTLKSGTINACDGNGGYGVRNYEGAEFVMNGGSIVTSYEDGDTPGNGYDASPVRVDEGATATINGGAINNVSNFTVAIDNYGTTTINDGTFTTIHTTIANSATMTINGGSFTCNGLEGITAHALWAAAGTTTINGGTFNGKDNYNGFNVCASEGAIVNIKGGKFLPVHSGSLYGEGTINVMGGEFFDDPSARVVEGYKAVKQNDFYTIVEDPAAMIGSEAYLSLQAAIEVVQDGETIVLQRDVNIATPAYGQNALNHAKAVNFTLDLNGKTISADTGNSVFRYNISQTGAASDITVTFKNGTITSGDNTWCTLMAAGTSDDVKAIFNLEDLTINASKAGDLAVKAWDYAVINAKNVTVNATKCAGGFYALGGEIVLDNCTVNQEGLHTAPYLSMALAVSNKGKMTVNSGNYTAEPTAAAEGYNQGTSHGSWCAGVMNSGGELIINGGTFANGNFGDDALANNARGLIFGDTASNIVINDGTFNALKTVIDYQNNLGIQPNPNIVINGGNFSANPAVVTSYGSVVLAEGKVAAQGADGRWTLVDGVMDEAGLRAAFEQGGNIVLGADITVSETLTLAQGKTAVLDLNGKTITATGYAIENYGTLKIEGNGTINGVVYGENGTTTVENGTFNPADGGAYVFLNSQGGTLTINGGTINGGSSYPIYSYDENSSLVINDVTVNATFGCVNAYGTNGSVVINGGTYQMTGVQGKTSHIAYFSNVDATINGGTFKKIGDINMSSAGGGGICAIYGANLTINGGNFAGDYADIYNWSGTNANGRAVAISITGGTYKFKPSFVANGYKAVEENGRWIVRE